jgi:hypothetical protein
MISHSAEEKNESSQREIEQSEKKHTNLLKLQFAQSARTCDLLKIKKNKK